MKIAILYIATGRYKIFWDGFYSSFEKHFFNGCLKHYFVFTDAPRDPRFSGANITAVFREKKGFPHDTLDRFEMFCSIKSELEKYDYVFFLNANTVCKDFVGCEILPDENIESGIVCVRHPVIKESDGHDYPYERNGKSLAYIANGAGELYVQAAFFGGNAGAFIRMSEILAENIRIDLSNKIIAVWHDESHLNKYILGKKIKVLGLEYLCPDVKKYVRKCDNNPKILLLEKSNYKYGGMDYIRGKSDKPITKLEYFFWKYFRFIHKFSINTKSNVN